MTGADDKSHQIEGDEFVDELEPGTQLLQGQFTIERFLNAGGFGITYLARNSLDRKVVIKECFPGAFCRRSRYIVQARSRAHQNELQSIVSLFVQEARSLAKLEHPNIVGVHQVFEDNNTAYMALDFVEGRDMLDIIEAENWRIDPPQVKEMLRRILGAVSFIHNEGMLHRDISPDNILVEDDGNPILIDFGAAREQATKKSRVLSAMRVVKDGYSPQEFYIAGAAQGPHSDLYALGATFYHIISGEIPPNSQARLSAAAQGDTDPYQPLADRPLGFDRTFLASIDKAMAVLPKDRMQSAQAWIAAIDGNTPKQFADPTDAVLAASATLTDYGNSDQIPANGPDKSKGKGGMVAVLLGSVAAAGVAVFFGMPMVSGDVQTNDQVAESANAPQATPPVAATDSEGNDRTEIAQMAPADVAPEPVEPTPEPQATAVAEALAEDGAEIAAEAEIEAETEIAAAEPAQDVPPVVEAPADAEAPATVPADLVPETVAQAEVETRGPSAVVDRQAQQNVTSELDAVASSELAEASEGNAQVPGRRATDPDARIAGAVDTSELDAVATSELAEASEGNAQIPGRRATDPDARIAGAVDTSELDAVATSELAEASEGNAQIPGRATDPDARIAGAVDTSELDAVATSKLAEASEGNAQKPGRATDPDARIAGAVDASEAQPSDLVAEIMVPVAPTSLGIPDWSFLSANVASASQLETAIAPSQRGAPINTAVPAASPLAFADTGLDLTQAAAPAAAFRVAIEDERLASAASAQRPARADASLSKIRPSPRPTTVGASADAARTARLALSQERATAPGSDSVDAVPQSDAGSQAVSNATGIAPIISDDTRTVSSRDQTASASQVEARSLSPSAEFEARERQSLPSFITSDAEPEQTVPISSNWTVVLPFVASTDDPRAIGAVTGAAPDWVREGAIVTSMNGIEIKSIEDIQDILRISVSIQDQKALPLNFTVAPEPGANSVEGTLFLPLIQETTLLDGTRFQAKFSNGVWRTEVTAVSGTDGPSGLKVGDVLVAYMATNEQIDTREGLGQLLQREFDAGVTNMNFAVRQDGNLWIRIMSFEDTLSN